MDLDEMDRAYQAAVYEREQERESNVKAHSECQKLTLDAGRLRAELYEQKANMTQARKQQVGRAEIEMVLCYVALG